MFTTDEVAEKRKSLAEHLQRAASTLLPYVVEYSLGPNDQMLQELAHLREDPSLSSRRVGELIAMGMKLTRIREEIETIIQGKYTTLLIDLDDLANMEPLGVVGCEASGGGLKEGDPLPDLADLGVMKKGNMFSVDARILANYTLDRKVASVLARIAYTTLGEENIDLAVTRCMDAFDQGMRIGF